MKSSWVIIYCELHKFVWASQINNFWNHSKQTEWHNCGQLVLHWSFNGIVGEVASHFLPHVPTQFDWHSFLISSDRRHSLWHDSAQLGPHWAKALSLRRQCWLQDFWQIPLHSADLVQRNRTAFPHISAHSADWQRAPHFSESCSLHLVWISDWDVGYDPNVVGKLGEQFKSQVLSHTLVQFKLGLFRDWHWIKQDGRQMDWQFAVAGTWGSLIAGSGGRGTACWAWPAWTAWSISERTWAAWSIWEWTWLVWSGWGRGWVVWWFCWFWLSTGRGWGTCWTGGTTCGAWGRTGGRSLVSVGTGITWATAGYWWNCPYWKSVLSLLINCSKFGRVKFFVFSTNPKIKSRVLSRIQVLSQSGLQALTHIASGSLGPVKSHFSEQKASHEGPQTSEGAPEAKHFSLQSALHFWVHPYLEKVAFLRFVVSVAKRTASGGRFSIAGITVFSQEDWQSSWHCCFAFPSSKAIFLKSDERRQSAKQSFRQYSTKEVLKSLDFILEGQVMAQAEAQVVSHVDAELKARHDPKQEGWQSLKQLSNWKT